ncbi:MAG TPA: hypothetical protein ENN29_10405 [Candidatus Hydrogenedentes bacterium]|nr:hypothetical protein [Candidatus Hydrogenedentota bacterium]
MRVALVVAALFWATATPDSTAIGLEAFPLRIVWDLHISPETEHVTEWLARQGWCWAVEVPPHAAPEQVLGLKNAGFVVVGQIHAHPETRIWHWSRQNMATPDIEAFVTLIRQANEEAPRIQFFMEDDSAGVGFSAAYLRNPPASHAAAKAMFDEYLETAMDAARCFPDVVPWAMAGFAGTSHHYARHGARCIIIERANDDVEDLQTAIAFARGAARQFGCEWGIDLSLWWGVIYGCAHNLPASFYKRHLWLSYISGAQVFRIEGGDLLVTPNGPTCVAGTVAEFASRACVLPPGKADAPVAVLLPQDHGWMTPAYWRTANESWNYARLPYRQGDRGIDGFFGAAFPSSVYAQDPFPKGAYAEEEPPASPFSLSCITPEFAHEPGQVWRAAPPILFGAYKNRRDAYADFTVNGIDPSPYRPMGDTRWGDVLDVITDDATVDAMAAYKVLIILGRVLMTDSLRERLLRYVEHGGSMIWAAGVASPVEDRLVGALIQPELRAGREWQWRNEDFQREAFRYCPVVLNQAGQDGLEMVAKTRSGQPLVLSHRIGRGIVYTCLVPWFEAGHTPLSRLALRLFDEVIRPLQPVVVEGPPAAWTCAKTEEALYVAIANHDDAVWKGNITARNFSESIDCCTDIIENETIGFENNSGGIKIDIDIKPFDVRVLQFKYLKK